MTESLLRYLEQPSSSRPKGVVNLRAVTSVLPVTLPHATIGLEICTPSRSYLLRYSTPAERDSWAASLEVRSPWRQPTLPSPIPMGKNRRKKVSCWSELAPLPLTNLGPRGRAQE